MMLPGLNSLARTVSASVVLMGLHSSFGIMAPHTPSLTVDESCYGTSLQGTQSVSIQGLNIRIVTHADIERTFQVQCFFLKHVKNDAKVSVDDTVIFDVINPHGTYEVTAQPIKISGAGSSKAAGSSKSKCKSKAKLGKSSKSPHPNKTAGSENPREGYVVRILNDGSVLRTYCSSHPLERLVEEDPSLLDQATLQRSARHLESSSLLKR